MSDQTLTYQESIEIVTAAALLYSSERESREHSEENIIAGDRMVAAIARVREMSDPWTLLAGDPRGGFQVMGPFRDEAAAEDHAMQWSTSDWWPIKISEPES